MFEISQELEKFKVAMNNYEHTESVLKREIMNLSQANTMTERKLQEMTISHSELDAVNRQMSEKLIVLQRENDLLQNGIELTKKHEIKFLVI